MKYRQIAKVFIHDDELGHFSLQAADITNKASVRHTCSLTIPIVILFRSLLVFFVRDDVSVYIPLEGADRCFVHVNQQKRLAICECRACCVVPLPNSAGLGHYETEGPVFEY